MSATNREVAHRLFAAEYDEATYTYSESDEERAPNYLVTPTGARVNRVFLVGVLTEVERVSEDVLRARVADPTGAFVVYAGQYQPDAMAFLERADPPMFVAVTGKARTFSPEDSDRVFTSVRPESVNEVDAETRDRWTVGAAEHTLRRVATFAAALALDADGDALGAALRESGVDPGLAAGIPRAVEQYGTTEHYLAAMADLAVDALGLVAGDVEEVPPLSVAPGDDGPDAVDVEALGAALEGAVVDLAEPADVDAAEQGTDVDSEDADTGEPDLDDAAGETGVDVDADEPGEGDDAGEAQATGDEDVGDSDGDAGDAGESDDDEGEVGESDGGAVDEEADEGEVGESDGGAVDEEADQDDDQAVDDVGTPADGGADADLGDFEPAGADAGGGPQEEVIDHDERERIEEEYGTDFATGTEVDEPGVADIEPEAGAIEPDGEPSADEAAATGDAGDTGGDEEDPGAESTDDGDAAADVDEAVMEAMAALDDGDGAEREALVASVVDDTGVDPGVVEDAIQDALMDGKCYEPDDEHVKPI